ncbi:MAG: contractile injection system protein, VgrG/Pvc8 family [Pseudomonadota bacterium]|jgi:phage protein D
MNRPSALAARVRIVYHGRDISADLAPYLARLEYIDRLDAESDSLDLELAEHDGSASRWLAHWYPEHGLEIEAALGYTHTPWHTLGRFEVDSVQADAPPLRLRIRALAVGLSKALRTRANHAYEGLTLAAIVDQVAQRLGLQRRGDVAALALDRVTQHQESDWSFLARLLHDYGYTLKLTDNNRVLAVARLRTLAQAEPLRLLRPSDLTAWSWSERAADVPQASEVSYHDPASAELLTQRSDGAQVHDAAAPRAADRDRAVLRARSAAQAQARAQAMQERHEAERAQLELSLMGDARLCAGAAFDLAGLARLDGRYVATQARHTLDAGGYQTHLTLARWRASGTP